MKHWVVSFIYRVRRAFEPAIAWIGNHPLAILPMPSVWLMIRYLPFWKDVDVVAQLLAAPSDINILHAPPIYCFLARIPFWCIDMLSLGTAPAILAEQHPSMPAVQSLIFLQHLSLWLALRYLLFSFHGSNVQRGLATIFLASIASVYTFAHTAGSEAMTAVTWITVFAAGLRILSRGPDWRTWAIYGAALLLAIGSRKVNSVLLFWLPVVLLGYWLAERGLPVDHRRKGLLWPTAGVASLVALGALGIEQTLTSMLCRQFAVIERPTDGATFSDRFVSVISHLTPAEDARILGTALAMTNDSNVRLAIQSQFRFGSYHLGGEQAIEQALAEEGASGEKLFAERDRVISQATTYIYRAMPPELAPVIVKEFVRTWVPTSDYRVARSGPFATFLFARFLQRTPTHWTYLPALPIFELKSAQHMLARVDRDPFINHWEGVPLVFWFLLFLGIGIWRLARHRISLPLFFVALTFIALGTLSDLIACIFAYSQPRYTLPLLVTVFGSGCILLFHTRSGDGRDSARKELY
jgi:hypothetical protein